MSKLTNDDYRSYWKVREATARIVLPIGGVVCLIGAYITHQWKYAIWGVIFLFVRFVIGRNTRY